MRPLSPRENRILAIGILCGLMMVLWGGLVHPAFTAWLRDRDRIVQLEQILNRTREATGDVTQVRVEIAKLRAMLADEEGLLRAQTVSIGLAQLQALGRTVIENRRGEIRSMQPIPAAEEEGMLRLGLRLEFRANSRIIQQVLYDFESHSPYLFLDNLSVQADRRGNEQGADSALPVRLDVLAYMRPAR